VTRATTPGETASAVLPGRTLQRSRILPWLAVVALLIVATVLRHVLAANTDVSWLLTVGERVLDGQHLYIDIIETNPPMAVLAYLPGIAIARALGLAAERVTDALVFIGIAVSLLFSARILSRASVLGVAQGWPLALLAVALLAVLPTQTFGQREHIALIAMLPMLAVLAGRIKYSAPSWPAAIAAGIGAAIALSFKPYFAIALLGALVAEAVSTRLSWRVLLRPEYLALAIALALYAAVVIVLFPEFLTVVGPMVRDVYLQVQQPVMMLLEKPAVTLWATALLAAVVLKRRVGVDGPFVLLLATSAGFAAGFVLQGKGWPYHSYPMIALALLAFGYARMTYLPVTRTDRLFGVGAVVLLALLFMRSMLWFDTAFDARPLQEKIAQLGPRPVILAISAEPGIGHPLVRAVGGTWVSRQQGLWVAAYHAVLRSRGGVSPAQDRLLEAYAARERTMLIEDIKKRPPTLVLVDDLTGSGSEWLKAHPDVADLLKDFRVVATINKVTFLTRSREP